MKRKGKRHFNARGGKEKWKSITPNKIRKPKRPKVK